MSGSSVSNAIVLQGSSSSFLLVQLLLALRQLDYQPNAAFLNQGQETCRLALDGWLLPFDLDCQVSVQLQLAPGFRSPWSDSLFCSSSIGLSPRTPRALSMACTCAARSASDICFALAALETFLAGADLDFVAPSAISTLRKILCAFPGCLESLDETVESFLGGRVPLTLRVPVCPLNV